MNGQTIFGILIIIVALVVMFFISAPTDAEPTLANLTPGSGISFLLDKILGVAIGIVLTGILAGIAAFTFAVIREAWDERKNGKWEPGPNAHFRRQQPKAPPQLSSDDLFKVALLNAMTNGNAAQYLPQITTSQNEDPPPADF